MKFRWQGQHGAGICRPPRGGRGLKSQLRELIDKTLKSPPSRGAWIEMYLPVIRR